MSQLVLMVAHTTISFLRSHIIPFSWIPTEHHQTIHSYYATSHLYTQYTVNKGNKQKRWSSFHLSKNFHLSAHTTNNRESHKYLYVVMIRFINQVSDLIYPSSSRSLCLTLSLIQILTFLYTKYTTVKRFISWYFVYIFLALFFAGCEKIVHLLYIRKRIHRSKRRWREPSELSRFLNIWTRRRRKRGAL